MQNNDWQQEKGILHQPDAGTQMSITFEDQMPFDSVFKLVKFLLDHILSDRESFITLG